MRCAVVVLLAGCGFSAKNAGTSAGDAAGGDVGAMIDGSGGSNGSSCTTHAVPPSLSVDASQWHASFLVAPRWTCNASGTTVINSMTGTVTSTSCALGTPDVTNNVAQVNGGSPVMVVRLRGLTVTNSHTLQLVGDKPIVILVAGDVVVDSGGMIDASASGATPGPGGSMPNLCTNAATGLGGLGSAPNWGGAGGGYGTSGGFGGYGTSGGAAGMANGDATLSPLRGGCSGGVGDTNFGVAQNAGAGGGAFELAASGTISIGATGVANLVASGGGAPANNGGGNGGGAGGAVLVVSPAAAAFGTMGALRANGGAGSEGCSSSCASPASGANGHKTDGTPALDTSGVPGGGNNMDHGRKGGLANVVGGASTPSAPGDLTAATNGGRGGGGGGGGRLRIATSAASTSCD